MYIFPALASVYAKLATLQGTDAGQGANLIGVQDAGSKFVGDTVEEVLTELDTHITNLTATDIAYTDTYEVDATNVQAIIDLIVNGFIDIYATFDTISGVLDDKADKSAVSTTFTTTDGKTVTVTDGVITSVV